MTGAVDTPISAVEQSHLPLVRRIQQALAPDGTLPGISVYLKTRDGATLPVMQNGKNAFEQVGSDTALFCEDVGIKCLTMDDGVAVYVRDEESRPATVQLVSAVVRASLQVLETEKREELLLEELGANWESLEALYEISTDALRSGDIKDALKRLIHRLTGFQNGLRSALFIGREGLFHPVVSTEDKVSDLTLGQLGVVEKALRDMRVVLVNQLIQTPDECACWHKATGLAVAPFSWKNSIGFVVVWCEDRKCEFDSPFSRVLEAITYQASVMMEGDRLNRKVRESELLAQEVEIASSIQQTLLLANAPRSLPDFEIAACSVPSQHIDGDFHDFFQHPDGTIDVLIGDVMGKGVAAALLGAATKSQFLRATANLALRSKQGAPSPAAIVTRAATRLSDRLIALERFVTLCYARFNPANHTLSFVDCGHTSMILETKSNEECTFLRGMDLPLGVLPDYQCKETSVEFRPGETYLLYSDGVTESRSPEGELFGPERLAECVQNWCSLGPALLVEQIRREAVKFTESDRFSDDFTCIAVRIKVKSHSDEPVMRRSANFECDPQILTRFRWWLRECAEFAGNCLGEDDIARLELACSEVFANCAIHAREISGRNAVNVEGRIFRDRVTVQINHQGPEFNPLSIPPPAFDGSREGGFGIYIVLRSADQASFSRDPDGTNTTTLSFLRTTRDPNS